MVATVGSYFVNSSDDVITQDAIDSIKKDIAELETDVKDMRNTMSDHKATPAHQGQAVTTEFFEQRLDSIANRLRDLEK